MKKNNLISIFATLFIISIFAYAFLPTTLAGVITRNSLLHLSGLLTIIGGIYVVRRYGVESNRGKALMFLTIGLSFWFTADVLYTIVQNVLNQPAFPSFIDLIYLLGYPIGGLGLYQELKISKIDWQQVGLAKYLIITLLLLIVAVYALFVLAYQPGTPTENVFNTLYNIGDIVLIIFAMLMLAIAYQFKDGKFYGPANCIFFGLIMTFIADILYAIFFQEYSQGLKLAKNIDLFYVASYLFFAYAFFSLGNNIKEAQETIKTNLREEII